MYKFNFLTLDKYEEFDSFGTEWDPYDEILNNESEDVLEPSDDECEDFVRF